MSRVEVENLVIGSGAGGATVFRTLAQAGREVLLLEEGEQYSHSFLQSHGVTERLSVMYRDGGLQPLLGSTVVTYGEGRTLGGTTELNGALFWPTPAKVMAEWRRLGYFGDWSLEAIQSCFASIERDLNVHGQLQLADADIDSQVLARGASSLGWQVTTARRAIRGCIRLNECGAGCPVGAKMSMTATYLPEGCEYGGQIKTGTRVFALESRDGRLINVVRAESNSGETIEIHPKTVFLAAGATQSPKLVASLSRGTKVFPFGIHLNAKIIAEFPDDICSEHGTIFTQQIQEFMDEGILIMATNYSEEFVLLSLTGQVVGADLQRLFRAKRRTGLYTVQTRPHSSGWIIAGRTSSHKFFRLSSSDERQLARGVLLACKGLFEAGAQEVRLPVKGLPACAGLSQVEHALRGVKRHHWLLSSVHGMGSLALPRRGRRLIDAAGRYGSFHNLVVSDASALPSTVGESPQGSIMLLARYLAERFLAES